MNAKLINAIRPLVRIAKLHKAHCHPEDGPITSIYDEKRRKPVLFDWKQLNKLAKVYDEIKKKKK